MKTTTVLSFIVFGLLSIHAIELWQKSKTAEPQDQFEFVSGVGHIEIRVTPTPTPDPLPDLSVGELMFYCSLCGATYENLWDHPHSECYPKRGILETPEPGLLYIPDPNYLLFDYGTTQTFDGNLFLPGDGTVGISTMLSPGFGTFGIDTDSGTNTLSGDLYIDGEIGIDDGLNDPDDRMFLPGALAIDESWKLEG